MINIPNWLIPSMLFCSSWLLLPTIVQAELRPVDCQNAKTKEEISCCTIKSECKKYGLKRLTMTTSQITAADKQNPNSNNQQHKAQTDLRIPNCQSPNLSSQEKSCCSMLNTCGGFGFKRPGDDEN